MQGIDWSVVHRRLAAARASMEAAFATEGERVEAMLRERALSLARLGRGASSRGGRSQILVVRAGAESYGMDLARLALIAPLASATPVPGQPREMVGLVNARGEIWSVFDLGRLLDDPAREVPASGQVLLLRHGRRRVGLRVDAVDRVQEASSTEPPGRPEGGAGTTSAFIRGVTGGSVIVIDLDALWTHAAIGEAPRHGT